MSSTAAGMHRGRALAICIALHAVLLAALIGGLVHDVVDGTRNGPLLIAAYVAASLVITTIMVWSAVRPAARRGAGTSG